MRAIFKRQNLTRAWSVDCMSVSLTAAEQQKAMHDLLDVFAPLVFGDDGRLNFLLNEPGVGINFDEKLRVLEGFIDRHPA